MKTQPRFAEIASDNFAAALDQVDDYSSTEAALDEYFENAKMTAAAEAGVSVYKTATEFNRLADASGVAVGWFG